MESLSPFRERIDRIDSEIVRLLGERFAVVREVAEVKGAAGIAPVLPERVETVKTRVAELGAAQGLEPNLMRALYTLIIDEACALEERLIAGRPAPSARP
jgi:chorismate mutase